MSHVFHRQLRHTYPTAVRGEGPYLYDSTGKRYIDGSGGAAVSCLGHSHPRVIAAIKAQLDKLPYVSNSFSRPSRWRNWLMRLSPTHPREW